VCVESACAVCRATAMAAYFHRGPNDPVTTRMDRSPLHIHSGSWFCLVRRGSFLWCTTDRRSFFGRVQTRRATTTEQCQGRATRPRMVMMRAGRKLARRRRRGAGKIKRSKWLHQRWTKPMVVAALWVTMVTTMTTTMTTTTTTNPDDGCTTSYLVMIVLSPSCPSSLALS
jgi:hypothetical protein